MQKDTSEIVKELQVSPDFQSFYRENKGNMINKSLTQLLEQLLEQTGVKLPGICVRPFDNGAVPNIPNRYCFGELFIPPGLAFKQTAPLINEGA